MLHPSRSKAIAAYIWKCYSKEQLRPSKVRALAVLFLFVPSSAQDGFAVNTAWLLGQKGTGGLKLAANGHF